MSLKDSLLPPPKVPVPGTSSPPLNTGSKVFMLNPSAVRAKIERLIARGPSDLACVSDFDATLTHPKSFTSWCVLERSSLTSAAYRSRTLELLQKYYPVEIDPTLSTAERSTKMVEWWRYASEALMAEKLHEDCFSKMLDIVDDKVILRDHCTEFFNECDSASVPILVFSAGIANVIDEVLLRRGLVRPRTHVCGNRLAFTDGIATHFETAEPIHVFNKHDGLLKGTAFERDVVGRSGVLLLGDSLGDVTMSSDRGHGGHHDCSHATVLRVGFLNVSNHKSPESHLRVYAEAFDVVLVDDGSLDFPLLVLRAVMGNASIDEVMAAGGYVPPAGVLERSPSAEAAAAAAAAPTVEGTECPYDEQSGEKAD